MPGRLLRSRPLWVAAAGFVLFACVAFAVPPNGGPDEPDHFVRSAAVVRGEWVGETVPATRDDFGYWKTRVAIDPAFMAAGRSMGCFEPGVASPACPLDFADPPPADAVITKTGRYPPAAYLLTGLGTLAGPRAASYYLARLVNAAVCAALLGGAAWSLRRLGAPAGGVAVLVVVTPAVVFIAGTINPSGPELLAALWCWLAVARVLEPEPPSRGDLAAVAVSASALALIRPLGPPFVVVVVVVVAVACGRSWASLRTAARRLVVPAAVVAVAAASMLLWTATVYGAETGRSVVADDPTVGLPVQVSLALQHFWDGVVPQLVGVLGWLDTPVPPLVLLSWFAVAAGLAASGAVAADRRGRVALALVVVATFAVDLAGERTSYALSRQFGMQGRHVAPILMGALLLPVVLRASGTRTLWQHRRVFVAVWVVLQLWVLAQVHRRFATGLDGNDPFSYLWDPAWVPPVPALVLLPLAAAALSVLGVALTAPERARVPAPVPVPEPAPAG